jgi:RNA polymerase sigma factor (TIGR02999 family)
MRAFNKINSLLGTRCPTLWAGSSESMADGGIGITKLLLKWSEGDEASLHQLTPLVYDELRRLARSYLRRHAFQNSLQPTVVAHEAWLKLVDQRQVTLQNRAQFFGLAAKIMRDLLVDYARERQAAKRGGDRERLSLSVAADCDSRGGEQIDLLALDEALNRLAQINSRRSRVVELRFFGGLTGAETAAALGVSEGTVERDWNLARAWLYNELTRQ